MRGIGGAVATDVWIYVLKSTRMYIHTGYIHMCKNIHVCMFLHMH